MKSNFATEKALNFKMEKIIKYDMSIWARSCNSELLKPIQGKIFGSIPKWINGSFLRNGAGKMSFGGMEFKHIFDGSALLHRFHIENGTVTYQNRFLQSDTFKKNQSLDKIAVSEFATMSSTQNIFQR